ncbi:hypothetical protein BNATCHR2106 (nucleomorph) [Bigelowiella natans]|uniref:Uncharacterized protein n=1 Tax=Bigelowiella natans TaxID=227086 RepID=Q3LW49_BIGNA|nr:hypothetical protein BNATCHR2106 [Bigelowiella natans]ABA27316.1 hypothetical protein [Bigelowiella natans]
MKNKIIRKYKQNKIQISLIFKNYLKEPTFYDIKLEISQKSRFLIKNYNTITFRIDKRFSKKNVKNLLENLLDTKIKKINSLNT